MFLTARLVLCLRLGQLNQKVFRQLELRGWLAGHRKEIFSYIQSFSWIMEEL